MLEATEALARVLARGAVPLLLLAVGCERPGSSGTSPAAAGTAAGASHASASPEDTAMKLTSSAFTENASIPSQHTCDGAGSPPPLAWAGAPRGTKSFALLVHDPDAPDPAAPKRDWVHWIVYDIPATTSALVAGAPELPAGARPGQNDWGKPSYGGPCPPVGRHRYFFELYALDEELGDLSRPKRAQLQRAMQGHVLAKAELVGTYESHE